MGNLNCFSPYRGHKGSRWYSEWRNNSSYANPYDYYDREYYERMNTNEPQLDPYNPTFFDNNANYAAHPTNMTSMSPSTDVNESYNFNVDSYDPNVYPHNNIADTNHEHKKDLQDNVTEAFMSDWFAREEAELKSNIKALQNCNTGSKEDIEDDRRSRQLKHKSQEDVGDISDGSSDSGMCDLDKMTKSVDKSETAMGFSVRKNGYCCYTAYILCNNSAEWDNILTKTSRIMTGLQRQYQCTIRFSDKISFHRGNSVRTFQIIGSNKGNVIKCKVALPQTMTKLLITSMSGSTEVEEYSRECSMSRGNINRRK